MKSYFIFVWVAEFMISAGVLKGKPSFISTSPEITETLYDLGVGNLIVATSIGSSYPPEALKIPLVGSTMKLSLEVVNRYPNAVVVFDESISKHNHKEKICKSHTCIDWNVKNIFDLVEFYKLMVGKFNLEKEPLVRLMNSASMLKEFKTSPFRFVIIAWSQPIVAIGKSFLSSLLERVGGTNVVERDIPSMTLSVEAVLKENSLVVFALGNIQNGNMERVLSTSKKKTTLVLLDWDKFGRSTYTTLDAVSILYSKWKSSCPNLDCAPQ